MYDQEKDKKIPSDTYAFMRELIEEVLFERSLRDWVKEKWVRIDTQGNITGPCGTMKDKQDPSRCLPEKKARSLTKAERAATARKKKEKGGPSKQFIPNTAKAKVTLETFTLLESDYEPTNKELWSRAKSAAKRKYTKYPSAYANLYASKWYKDKGGKWKKKKKVNEENLTVESKASCCGRCGRIHIPKNQGGRGCKKPYLSKNSPQHCKNK